MIELCDTCWMQPAATGSTECDECHRWSTYYRSLTPRQRIEESRMMADYVSEVGHD